MSAGAALGYQSRGPVTLQMEVHDRQVQEGWLAGELGATSNNRLLIATTIAYVAREELFLGASVGVLAPTVDPSSEQVVLLDLTMRYRFDKD